MTVRVGFIGTGNIASTHTKNISKLKNAKLAAFADIDRTRAQKYAALYGGTAYTDYDQMLDKEELSAVFICTPHFVRLEPIKAAAERRIALFCEKPPAFDLESAKEITDIINKTGIINSVGFMYRWAEITNKVKSIIAKHPINICLNLMAVKKIL